MKTNQNQVTIALALLVTFCLCALAAGQGRIDIIRAELLAGHPVTGAYSADAETAAAQMNALNIEVSNGFTPGFLRSWAAADGRARRIYDIQSSALGDGPKSIALMLQVTLELPNIMGLDGSQLDEDQIKTWVDTLVTVGALDQDDRDALANPGFISRGAQLGVGEVKPGHVEEARR